MVKVNWKVVFFAPNPDALVELDEFLYQRLDRHYGYRIGHGNRVIVEEGLRDADDAWRVAEWVRNRAPVQDLRYMVVGYEGLRIGYVSYCPMCRQGRGPHWEHQPRVQKLKKGRKTK